jgi:NADPH:quinone reductase-like Zn-dependent oxidoreductase
MVTATMKVVILYKPGGSESLKIEQRPIPKANKGDVLIQVKAFGLNRSELFTRLGLSPNVKLPRILGIEAVGLIHEAPGGEFPIGQVVATCMGGLGREVDGGYAEYTLIKAEYTLIKAEYARAIETEVPWNILGALPEMLQTSWGGAEQKFEDSGRRNLAHPWWDYFCWTGSCSDCEESGIDCSGHHAASGSREARAL